LSIKNPNIPGGLFVDTVDGAVDAPARALQAELKTRVRDTLPAKRLYEYRVKWAHGGLTMDMHGDEVRTPIETPIE
jgi:hypothetical protein